MQINKKRAAAVVGATAVALAGAGVAFAFWTTTGGGPATATTGTDTAVQLTGSTVGAVTPGGTTGTVSFSAKNTAAGPETVGTIHLVSVAAYSDSGRTIAIPTGTGVGKCDVSQYSMVDVPENQSVPGGGVTTALSATGTLVLANDSVNNQDSCKGAFLTLTLSS